MILQSPHSHLYPGQRGRVSGLAQIADMQTGDDCLVAFADGSVACATLSRTGDGWQLDTDAYRTAAATDIAQKSWLVQLQQDGADVQFRILKKL